MKPKCCLCRFIINNPDYDNMLDCELSPEDSDLSKCCYKGFNLFEKEQNSTVVDRFVNEYSKQYNISVKSINEVIYGK